MAEDRKTETGIDIANYTANKSKGAAVLLKGAIGNYIYQSVTVSAEVVNGVAKIVQGTPSLANVNRQSLTEFKAKLDTEISALNSLHSQADAMLADMDALDAQ